MCPEYFCILLSPTIYVSKHWGVQLELYVNVAIGLRKNILYHGFFGLFNFMCRSVRSQLSIGIGNFSFNFNFRTFEIFLLKFFFCMVYKNIERIRIRGKGADPADPDLDPDPPHCSQVFLYWSEYLLISQYWCPKYLPISQKSTSMTKS